MRRLAAFFLLAPLACGPQPKDAKDSPPTDAPAKAEPAADTAPEDEAPKDAPPMDAPPKDAPADGDCVSTSGLPPGSIPDSIAKYAELDLAALEAALPKDPRDPDLANSDTSPWKRGAAGHPSPMVMRAIKPPGGKSSIMTITDLVHVCHCGEGMGKRLLAAAVAAGDAAEKIDGRDVAVKAKENVTDLRVWIGDRCELLIRASTRGEAETLFKATDWATYEKTCTLRDAPKP